QSPAHRMHLIAAKIWFTSILVPATVQYGKSKPFRHPSIGHDHHEYHLAQPTQSPPYPGGGRSSSGRITPDRGPRHQFLSRRSARTIMNPTCHNPPTRRPTLAEVAAVAGVSHQTVSRVINSYPGVRPATRERVQDAVRKLGYRRNTAARSLVTRESRLIGVIAIGAFLLRPTLTISRIERAARDNGHMTFLATMKDAEEADLNQAIGQCLERSVDILILIANREVWVHFASKLD